MSAVPEPETFDAEEQPPIEEPDHDEWAGEMPPVTDPTDAEWRLRRLRRIVKQRAEVYDTFQRLQAETADWYARESEGLDAEIASLERQLLGWLNARIELDPKGPKNVSLPSGRLSSTAGTVVTEVTDEEAFMAWAREHRPDLIDTPAPKPPVSKPDKAKIKALVTDHQKLPDPGDYPVEVEILMPSEDEAEPQKVKAAIPGVHVTRKDRTVKVEFNTIVSL